MDINDDINYSKLSLWWTEGFNLSGVQERPPTFQSIFFSFNDCVWHCMTTGVGRYYFHSTFVRRYPSYHTRKKPQSWRNPQWLTQTFCYNCIMYLSILGEIDFQQQNLMTNENLWKCDKHHGGDCTCLEITSILGTQFLLKNQRITKRPSTVFT